MAGASRPGAQEKRAEGTGGKERGGDRCSVRPRRHRFRSGGEAHPGNRDSDRIVRVDGRAPLPSRCRLRVAELRREVERCDLSIGKYARH
ncbi:hypothetical protein E2562_012710 [Oryza meyeriana var. granulata]|uniref:Uncharacterized protein n=1 Tax=Oryza meyeriana var. granulata TaxID=110450 RepID=A0A6G1CFQ9_9ORYZ|nr:hypothetical protein E2562_012710 [Oryza meyeriana var. granulata]